jgi:hypothetical protein
MCDRRDVFDDPDEEDAFEFGYNTAMDFWYDEKYFKCTDMHYFVKELKDEVFNECKYEYEDFDDEEDLNDSCEEEVHVTIE